MLKEKKGKVRQGKARQGKSRSKANRDTVHRPDSLLVGPIFKNGRRHNQKKRPVSSAMSSG